MYNITKATDRQHCQMHKLQVSTVRNHSDAQKNSICVKTPNLVKERQVATNRPSNLICRTEEIPTKSQLTAFLPTQCASPLSTKDESNNTNRSAQLSSVLLINSKNTGNHGGLKIFTPDYRYVNDISYTRKSSEPTTPVRVCEDQTDEAVNCRYVVKTPPMNRVQHSFAQPTASSRAKLVKPRLRKVASSQMSNAKAKFEEEVIYVAQPKISSPLKMSPFPQIRNKSVPPLINELSSSRMMNKPLANSFQLTGLPAEMYYNRMKSDSMRPPPALKNHLIDRKWQCLVKIGSGSFGETYLARHVMTGQSVAVKIESVKTKHPQLLHEAQILKILQKRVSAGFPKLYFVGSHLVEFYVIVIELLGSTLEEIFVKWANKSFSNITTAMIGMQILDRINTLHSEGFLHRDIKPDNFLVGPRGSCDKIYMIDFGLSKSYIDQESREHIAYRNQRSLIGTARYVSLSVHLGVEPSRRDDLESCGYLMVYFLKGGILPWQGLKALTKQEKYEKILKTKKFTSLQVLTQALPQEIYLFILHCRKLAFDEEPDYGLLRGLLAAVIHRELLLSNAKNPMVENSENHEKQRKGQENDTRNQVCPKTCLVKYSNPRVRSNL